MGEIAKSPRDVIGHTPQSFLGLQEENKYMIEALTRASSISSYSMWVCGVRLF